MGDEGKPEDQLAQGWSSLTANTRNRERAERRDGSARPA
jgi:hypothetical protein